MTLALPAGRGVPMRPLAVLAVVVLAAHLLLLQARPGALSLSSPWRTQPLVMRVIEATPQVPAPQVADPAPAPPPAQAPAPVAPPAVQAEASQSAPTAPPPVTELAQPAPAAPPPGPVQTVVSAFRVPGSLFVRYSGKGASQSRPFTASANLAWRHDGTQYQARLKIDAPRGARAHVSTGRLTADGLVPTRFGDVSRTEQAAHFVRDKGIISFSNNAPDAALQAGAQDRLSVLLQLGAMLAADPARYPQGTRVDVQTAGVRDADTWTFTVEGREELQIRSRARATIKLERLPQHEFDEKVELWVAPDMDYLPVRVRLTQQGGDFVDLLWDGADKL